MEAKYAAMVKEKTPVLGTTSISRKVRTCQTFVLIIHVPTVVDGVSDVPAGHGVSIYA